MNKMFIVGVLGLLLVGFASSYICIYPDSDNVSVQEFKININRIAIQEDINKGITEEGLKLKLKYFNPCR